MTPDETQIQRVFVDWSISQTRALDSKSCRCRNKETSVTGADPGFFLGGGAPLRNDVTDR